MILEINKVQHVKWCMKQTKLTSEISWPTDSYLAQLVRHWPEDPEVLVSIPTEGNFWRIFFCSSLWKDLSDNLTETPIVKNSNIVAILQYLDKSQTIEFLHRSVLESFQWEFTARNFRFVIFRKLLDCASPRITSTRSIKCIQWRHLPSVSIYIDGSTDVSHAPCLGPK